jgi:hypothetical protein
MEIMTEIFSKPPNYGIDFRYQEITKTAKQEEGSPPTASILEGLHVCHQKPN